MSIDTLFVKMHTGDPGAGGAANAAVNVTRKLLSCANESDASARLVQDAVIAYTGGEVTTTETYAWVSYWDAVTAGTWLGNEDITNQAATAASPLNIAVGTILVTATRAIDFATRAELATAVPTAEDPVVQFRRRRLWRRAFMHNAYKAQQAKFARQSPQQI
jgi:hypothetical protein